MEYNVTTYSVISEMDNSTANVNTTNKAYYVTSYLPILLVVPVWMVVSNVMIMVAPLVHPPLFKKKFILVSSLAVADLITAISQAILWSMELFREQESPWLVQNQSSFYVYCKSKLFFNILPVLASILNLFLLALDRYIAIVYPHRYNVIWTKRKVRIGIILSWMWSVGTSCLVFMWTSEEMTCTIEDIPSVYGHIFLGLQFWLMTIVLFILYFLVYKTIRQRAIEANEDPVSTNLSKRAKRSEQLVTKMMLINLGVFTACWAPTVLLLHLFLAGVVGANIFIGAYIIAFLNSGMNFFIYAARNDTYRTAFRLMCCCCCKK